MLDRSCQITIVLAGLLVAVGCERSTETAAADTPQTAPAVAPDASSGVADATQDGGEPSVDERPSLSTGAGEQPRSAPPRDDLRTARFHGLVAPKPATWLWHPPQNRMRTGNWIVPGRDGSDMAELVVFGFPEGQGGSKQENLDRWARQFRVSEGEPAVPRISTRPVGDLEVTLVELSGEQMKVGTGWFTPDQKLLGAVIETHRGLVFLRLDGPAATVDQNRRAFMKMIDGLRREGDDG